MLGAEYRYACSGFEKMVFEMFGVFFVATPPGRSIFRVQTVVEVVQTLAFERAAEQAFKNSFA